MGDASWFPTPPPKTGNPVEATRLVTGGMLALVAIAAIVLALTSSHSHKPSTRPTTTSGPQGRDATRAEQRAAFNACLKSAGVSGGGRFGRGSGDKVQAAVSLCSGLLGGGGGGGPTPSLQPIAPAHGVTGAPPAA